MPPAHRCFAGWTPERLRRDTAALIEAVLGRGRHPEQGIQPALGILRLARSYEPEPTEAVPPGRSPSARYTSLASILKSGLDRHRSRTPQTGR